jgi:hypothetical protein
VARETTFVPGTVVTSQFLNDRQDLETALMFIRVEVASPTSLRVPIIADGSAAPSTPAIINGQPRNIAAPYVLPMSASSYGSSAVTYDVYATLQGSTITAGFVLQLVARTGGAPYGGTPGTAPANSRKVAEVDWSGAAIYALRNTVELAGHAYLHTYGLPAGYGDPLPAGSIDLSQLMVSAQNRMAVTGDLKFGLQTGDHGLNADGSYAWLLITGGTDGTGRPVSGTTYASLRSAMGNPALDGNGNFKLPPVQQRSLVAAGGGGLDMNGVALTTRTAGQTGGEETHPLANAEMPGHQHGAATGFTSTDHYHTYGGESGTESAAHDHTVGVGIANTAKVVIWTSGAQGAYWVAPGTGSSTYTTSGESVSHAHGYSGADTWQSTMHSSVDGSCANPVHQHPIGVDGNNGAVGPGQRHNTMAPFFVMNAFVKT